MTHNSSRQTEREAYTGDTIVMPRQRPTKRPAPAPRRPPPPRRIWPTVRRGLLIGLTLLLIALGFGYMQIRSVAAPLVVRDVRHAPPLLSPLATGINVLIIGVDERPDHPEEGVRSDTLIVARLNGLGRWVNLLSIPRDSRVSILDVGETKINVAYGEGYARTAALYGDDTTPQEGGMALAAQTAEQFLGLPSSGQRIDYVVQVNFDGFANIIDALGGIIINVPQQIIDDEYPTPDFGITRIEFQPGVQAMDGATALIYARTRHADSDFGRAARQQQVIRAIAVKLRQLGPAGIARVLPTLREGLHGSVATTMPIARPDMLAGLAWLAGGLDADDIGQTRLGPELDPQFQEDGSDLVWSADGVKAAVSALLTPPGAASEDATVQVLNGAGVSGLAGEVSLRLAQDGFSMVPADNAPMSDAERTIVYDLTGKPRTSRRLADALNADVRAGPAPEGVASQADIVVILGQAAAR